MKLIISFGKIVFSLFCLLLVSQCTEESVQDPGERYGHSIIYNPIADHLLLFGGFREDRTLLGDTWVFDEGHWEKIKSKIKPPARKWPAMAVNSETGRVLLHGGRVQTPEGESPSDQTWVFEKNEWSILEIPGPPALDHHSLVFDKQSQRFVLFGGWTGESLSDETWVFDKDKWVKINGASPSPRAPLGLSYHPVKNTVFLYGGKDLKNFYQDTWQFNENKWQKMDISGPTARAFHGMTFDENLDGFLVFSGRFNNKLYQETWLLKDHRWQLINSSGPNRRGVFSMAYFRPLKASVFYGGGILTDGQWFLEKGLWGFIDSKWQRID